MLPLEFKAYSVAIKTALWAAPVGFAVAMLQADSPYTELWRASLTVIGTLLLLIGRSVLQNQKKLSDDFKVYRQRTDERFHSVEAYQQRLQVALVRVIFEAYPDRGPALVKVIDEVMKSVNDV
jgi:hypothetical protein